VPLNHSSDLKTWEEVFNVFDGFLGHAGDPQVSDLSSLFQPDTVAPEPSSMILCGIGGLALVLRGHRRRRERLAGVLPVHPEFSAGLSRIHNRAL